LSEVYRAVDPKSDRRLSFVRLWTASLQCSALK